MRPVVSRSTRSAHRPPVWVSLGVSMVVAGAVYPVTAFALDSTTPIMVATLRALLGGVLLTVALPLFGSRLPRGRRLWRWAFLIGLGNTTITQVAISVATDRAGAAVASVLLNSSPFIVAVASRLLFGERITRLRAVGLVIGFAGVVAIVLADPGDVSGGTRLAVGLVLALAGAAAWAASGLGMRELTRREPDLDVPGMTAAQFLAGAVPLVPLALVAGGTTDWSEPSLLLALAFLIVGGQVLVYVGFNDALSRWPPTRVYAWTFVAPASAVAIEAARRNLPGALGTLGIGLVIVGVAIVNAPRAEARPLAQDRGPAP
jgi:drug/metabolite transporter (DMT)-like permease